MNNEFAFLAGVASLYTLLAVSPGPNFLVITQAAISRSRMQALVIAFGVSTASVLWAAFAALGLGLILANFPSLQQVLQVIGGIYLCYVGIRLIWNSRKPLLASTQQAQEFTLLKAYCLGFFTNLANPKTLMFFTSVFASLFTSTLAYSIKFSGVLVVAIISIAWNVLLVTVFSIGKVRLFYAKAKYLIDCIVGTFMILFSIKLMFGY